MVDISQTSLGKNIPGMIQDLDALFKKAEDLGAHTGVQRLELLCDQYDKITPDIAYHLLDFDSFQQEIEEAQIHTWHVDIVHYMRNISSLLPLIATWCGLYFAVSSYQQDISKIPPDRSFTFLQLWQGGFHGTTWLTFSTTAFIDVILLIVYLVMLLWSHILDSKAHATAIKFTKELRTNAEKILDEVNKASLIPITDPQDLNRVTIAIRQVLDQALEQSKQLAQITEQTIQSTNERIENLFSTQITPYFNTFSTQTTYFQSAIIQLQKQVDSLTQTIQTQTGQVDSLNISITNVLKTSQDFHTQLGTLNQSKQMVAKSLNDLSKEVIKVTEQMTSATRSLEGTTQLMAGTVTQIDQTLQTVTSRIQSNENNILTFQHDLITFQSKSADLHTVIADFAHNTTALGTQVQQYFSLGEDLASHVSQLQVNEQSLLTGLGAVARGIHIAAQSMDTATTCLQKTANAVSGIAQSINSNVQTSIDQVSTNFDRATRALGQVENQLSVTTTVLAQVATQLSTLDPEEIVEPSLRNRNRGFIRRFFFHNRNQTRGARKP